MSPDLKIPKGWSKVTLGDVAIEYSVRVKNPAESEYKRFVGSNHIGRFELAVSNWGSTSEVTSAMKVFQPGDYLLVRRSLYASDFRERAARADFEGVCSGDILTIREKENVIAQGFLSAVLNTPEIWAYIVAHATGSITRRIKWRQLQEYEFALPPLEEQRRIAELLRSAMKVIEALLNTMKSAEKLLRSAIDAAAKKAIDSQSVTPLADLVDAERPICYGILMPGTGFDGGIPVVKVKDYPDGEIIEDGLLLTDPKIDDEYKRSRLRTGDLLISIRGTIGRLALVPMSLDGANITQDTARLSIRAEHDSRYVRAMLESTFVQRQIAAFTTGLAVKGINIGELRRIRIPIVSPEEQQEVAQEVIDVRAAIRVIEDRLDQSKRLLKMTLTEHIGGNE